MNIFNIPSWYPSNENPIYGTFVKEQIEMLARENPDWNFGVSTWGQGRPSHMLPMKDHIINLRKFVRSRKFQAFSDHQNNISHFYSPVLTWTRKVHHGNLSSINKANDKNLLSFKRQVKNIDVIHAQATYPGALIAQVLSEKYGIPYVVSIRMSPFPFDEFLTKQGKLKSLINQPLQKANALIATSNSLKKRMETFGLSNIQVIHNPVDTEFFKPLDYKPKELTLLTVGRLEHQKGIDILIESIALLGDEFIGKVRIAGDGSMRRQYE
ncbi:MAG: glycosyltransferase family 4 protein [Cytophagales bacterium]|nr:glycosyltransferase family 4 protein [Cytophagales bacterium]